MSSSHRNVKGHNDSVHNSSKISSSNVNSLRKLFESNFKLSNITNAFKSKSNREDFCPKDFPNGTQTGDRTKSSAARSKENRKCRPNAENTVSKIQDHNAQPEERHTSQVADGNYLNCKIENCCCKTFFREYNETPNFRYRPLPKTPLRDRSSEFNCSQSGRVDGCESASLNSCASKNKFFKINYEFYKSKTQQAFDGTPLSTVTEKKFERACKSEGKNLFEKVDGAATSTGNQRPQTKTVARPRGYEKSDTYGFVNFTAASLSEGGYVKPKDEQKKSLPYRESKKEASEMETLVSKEEDVAEKSSSKTNVDDEIYKIGNFTFKYKVPKIKNLAIREHSYPYSLRKPRLTVKGVKNRNMRNIKRRQKFKTIDRSQTFNGYDNFAYRRSITELHLSKYERGKDEKCETVGTPSSEPADSGFCGNVDLVGDSNNRMQGYSWPITSFYIDKNAAESFPDKDVRRYSSSYNLNGIDANRPDTIGRHKTNLKRHCSLGYLEDECSEYDVTRRHRRSLDNITEVSAACGTRTGSEINNKAIKLKKLQNVDIHVHALFAAVEHGYVEKTKTILESSEVNVNSVNSDGLSPLDVAVLSNNKPLLKLLVAHGAQEGRKFRNSDDMRNHLYHLMHEAERRVQELASSLRLDAESDLSVSSSSSSNVPSNTFDDNSKNKTYSIWKRRAKGLKRMLVGFEQIRPPDLPASVTIEVTSTSSVMVYFSESENKDSSITTKFKVQWSMDEDFCSLCGHYEIVDTRQLQYQIGNLRKGRTYYVRVASGNIRGYSVYKLSTPSSIIPSSWQDITEKDAKSGSLTKESFDGIFSNVALMHPYLQSNVEPYGQGADILVNQRRKKTTIKQLFTVNSKFQKHLRRGIHLACLLYHEDKVLVTNEDFLPVIEVDENYPKKIYDDFHWFFKVAFSWSDLKWLKNEMEKSQNSSAIFRMKVLQAASYMQAALGIQELGKLYYKLLTDAEGTLAISVINYVHSPKSVSALNLKWLPLAKLTKKTNSTNLAQSNVADILMSSIPDQITYHQVSGIKLPKGLYLSYLKMRSSVDSLQIFLPSRVPNVPPHCKVRDNPHVTAEEWEWLVKKENLRDSSATATYQQRQFIEQVVVTARRLFTYMKISDEEAADHRLYDAEIIEVSKDVSLIVVVPPPEAACSMLGQREPLLQRSDLLPLTVQVFEMVHFGTYQLDLMASYARLSCVLEMDVDLAQHGLRKAFNAVEVDMAKTKLDELENLHRELNVAWKKIRWLLDVITFARDRQSSPTRMDFLLHVHPKRALPSVESHSYRSSSNPKLLKSRGSWPDIDVERHLRRTPNAVSRSEQELTHDEGISITQSPATKTGIKDAASKPKPAISVTTSDNSDAVVRLHSSRIVKNNSTSTLLRNDSSSSSSIHSTSSDDPPISETNNDKEKKENGIQDHVPGPVVIKIYAAYDTGLGNRIHFKFHVSPKITAKEIVELFVKQTNMSVLLKGKERPIYAVEELANFCLVAVIGARERCLRDTFRLVQLQQPWKDGRLYVRRKSNVLAAIECESEQSSYV